jgi:hypothetical protein
MHPARASLPRPVQHVQRTNGGWFSGGSSCDALKRDTSSVERTTKLRTEVKAIHVNEQLRVIRWNYEVVIDRAHLCGER